jgi:putative dimethyl sulfoxide reductase chaperone
MNERQLLYQARQAVYVLLQRLYVEAPDQNLFDWLALERPFCDFPVVLESEVDIARQQVDDACQNTSLNDLKVDFIQLYLAYGGMKVAPWESVYRNEERTLFDLHTLLVRETYARHGMEFIHKNKTPEDHIAIELEFMKVLTERLLVAVNRQDIEAEQILLREQAEFLKDHMLIWVPEFASLSQTHARTSFYRGLATVLHGFLCWEQQTVEELLNVVEDLQLTSETK